MYVGAIGCVLSNADSAKTPRTSLETTQRTNRTFFIMMFPFAGHENIVFFSLFKDTTWRAEREGGKGGKITFVTWNGKKNWLWPPWYSTNGMSVE